MAGHVQELATLKPFAFYLIEFNPQGLALPGDGANESGDLDCAASVTADEVGAVRSSIITLTIVASRAGLPPR